MNGMGLALGAYSLGALGAVVGTAAQSATEAGGSALPYGAAGAAAVTAAALAYIAKKFATGDAIAKPVAEYQRELALMLAASTEREDRLQQLAERLRKMSADQHKQQEATNRLLWRVEEHLGGPEERTRARRNQ